MLLWQVVFGAFFVTIIKVQSEILLDWLPDLVTCSSDWVHLIKWSGISNCSDIHMLMSLYKHNANVLLRENTLSFACSQTTRDFLKALAGVSLCKCKLMTYWNYQHFPLNILPEIAKNKLPLFSLSISYSSLIWPALVSKWNKELDSPFLPWGASDGHCNCALLTFGSLFSLVDMGPK